MSVLICSGDPAPSIRCVFTYNAGVPVTPFAFANATSRSICFRVKPPSTQAR